MRILWDGDLEPRDFGTRGRMCLGSEPAVVVYDTFWERRDGVLLRREVGAPLRLCDGQKWGNWHQRRSWVDGTWHVKNSLGMGVEAALG